LKNCGLKAWRIYKWIGNCIENHIEKNKSCSGQGEKA